jgi:hypothetical protein
LVSYLGKNEDAEMEARQRISNASYSPEALKVLFQAFDEAWNNIAGNFGGNPLAVQAARLKLANIMLDLGASSGDDPERIKNAALEIMARDLRTGAS